MKSLKDRINEGFFDNVSHNVMYDGYFRIINDAVMQARKDEDKDFKEINDDIEELQARWSSDSKDPEAKKLKDKIIKHKAQLDKKYTDLDSIPAGTKISFWHPSFRFGYMKTKPSLTSNGLVYCWGGYSYKMHLDKATENSSPCYTNAYFAKHISGLWNKGMKIIFNDEYEIVIN